MRLCPVSPLPRNKDPCPLWAIAQALDCEPGSRLQSGYLDGLRCARPLLGTASSHVQEEGLEPAWQGQLVVSGNTELGCRPQDRSHTVHGGLRGGKSPAVISSASPTRLPQGNPGRCRMGAPVCTPALRLFGAWRPRRTPSQLPRGPGLGSCVPTKCSQIFTLKFNSQDLRPQWGPPTFHCLQAGGGCDSGFRGQEPPKPVVGC